MARHLTVFQCPSVGGLDVFYHEGCTKCQVWWKSGACSAQQATAEVYSAHLDRHGAPPPCALSDRCRWHLDAVRASSGVCVVRRLGEVCEHQGGIWNTFDVAPPDEWDEALEKSA
jgi:hypothetical protein